MLYENPRLRARDINNAFTDDSIDGIICSIGGYESIRILPYLDTEEIIKNPKLILPLGCNVKLSPEKEESTI